MSDSPYRILMVLDSLGTGGTETHVISLSKSLIRKGAKLIYAGPSGPFYQTFADVGFQVHIQQPCNLSLAEQKKFQLQHYKQIISQERINFVHVHQTPSGILAALAARESGVPVVFTMHGTYYPHEEAIKLAMLSQQVISVSKPVKQFWQRHGINSIVISNGIDLEEYQPQKEEETASPPLHLPIPSKATIITYVSRIAWGKATVCQLVMRAVKTLLPEMPNSHLVIVGSGAQFKQVEEMANSLNQSLGRACIHVVGERIDVRPFYQASDLVIGTGRVALEAMAMGKPVLAIGNHGFFGVVQPDVYNLAWDYYFGDHYSLYKPSVPLIVDSLRRALNGQVNLQEVGAQAREWVATQFDINQKSGQLVDVYDSIRQM